MYENAVVKNYREHRELLHFSATAIYARNSLEVFNIEVEKHGLEHVVPRIRQHIDNINEALNNSKK